MRTFLIGGFGEDAFIFEKIVPALRGEHLVLSLWLELSNQPVPWLNAATLAQDLATKYGITHTDLVIGHSTGGWVGLFIKQITGCALVQIASWTNPEKVVATGAFRQVIYWAAKTGLYLNPIVLRFSIWKHYRHKPSRGVYEQVFRRLITGNRYNVVNQLRLIFNTPALPVTVSPDLRIHARQDPIVRFPDEPVQAVPGDHFALYTHAQEVCQCLNQYFQNK